MMLPDNHDNFSRIRLTRKKTFTLRGLRPFFVKLCSTCKRLRSSHNEIKTTTETTREALPTTPMHLLFVSTLWLCSSSAHIERLHFCRASLCKELANRFWSKRKPPSFLLRPIQFSSLEAESEDFVKRLSVWQENCSHGVHSTYLVREHDLTAHGRAVLVDVHRVERESKSCRQQSRRSLQTLRNIHRSRRACRCLPLQLCAVCFIDVVGFPGLKFILLECSPAWRGVGDCSRSGAVAGPAQTADKRVYMPRGVSVSFPASPPTLSSDDPIRDKLPG